MSDIAEAPTQAAIADSLVAEEPQEQVAEQPVTEQQPEPEAPEQTVEQEQQPVEEEQEWLPSDQDRTFPDEILQRYSQRYGLDENLLANPQLKQLLVDKINSDIFLKQQQEQQAEEPEEQPQDQPAQTQPQLTREQYFQNLDRVVQERTDPEVAKGFSSEFLSSVARLSGVPETEIPKMLNSISPQAAMAFTHTASKYMLNMVQTFMPDILQALLPQQVSQAFPGFGEMYERSAYATAWDRVRNSNPQYSNLPAYGTKEFSKTLREAAGRIPGFDEMQFTDANGKPLPMLENSMRKYGMLAQIASGQNVNPQLLQQAAAAGAKRARQAEVRRSAGNLGSGQSKAASGQSGSNKFQTNTDIFDDDTMAIWNREHGRI